MFAIGGSTGQIVGNAVAEIAPRGTYYVAVRFHLVLSLGAVIAISSGIMYLREIVSGDHTTTSAIDPYRFITTFYGTPLTFTQMHFLDPTVTTSGISDFPNYFNFRCYPPSIGSGIAFISWFYQINNRTNKIDLLLNVNRFAGRVNYHIYAILST